VITKLASEAAVVVSAVAKEEKAVTTSEVVVEVSEEAKEEKVAVNSEVTVAVLPEMDLDPSTDTILIEVEREEEVVVLPEVVPLLPLVPLSDLFLSANLLRFDC
jgi:hypothetical protein